MPSWSPRRVRSSARVKSRSGRGGGGGREGERAVDVPQRAVVVAEALSQRGGRAQQRGVIGGHREGALGEAQGLEPQRVAVGAGGRGGEELEEVEKARGQTGDELQVLRPRRVATGLRRAGHERAGVEVLRERGRRAEQQRQGQRGPHGRKRARSAGVGMRQTSLRPNQR